MNLARKHSRFAAYLIDHIIIGLVNLLIFGILFIVYVLFAGVSLSNISNIESIKAAVGLTFLIIAGLLSILISIATVIYYAHYLSKNSQTPGMKFVGIKAQKEDGSNLTFQEAAIRYIVLSILGFLGAALAYIPYVGIFLYIPAMFGIYFWCLIDKKQQNVYDMIHHVIYIKDNENEKRSKIVIGSYFGCGCLTIAAIIIGVSIFVSSSWSAMEKISKGELQEDDMDWKVVKTVTGIIPKKPESYSQKSDRLEKECMQNNDAKNFSSLSGYCSCLSLYELDESVPNEKKEEVKAQECGYYRKSNPTTTIKPLVTTPAESYYEMTVRLQKECIEINDSKNFSSISNYCNCAVLTSLSQAIPENKKTEVVAQNCGFYKTTNAPTSIFKTDKK